MHRHRRCVQIMQPFAGTLHGYDTPEDLGNAGLTQRYDAIMRRIREAEVRFKKFEHAREAGQYIVPLAFRCRTLFKMDFAEALYIAELRTTPAGHFSYRRVAYAMYEAVGARYTALAKHFRVNDVREAVDLLKR
jgi:thymidylate synthase ThyX